MNNEIVERIIGRAEKIVTYGEKASTYDNFSCDPMLVDACAYNLIQIEGLINKLDESFIKQYQDIKWHEMDNMLTRIVNENGVDAYLIWQIISNDLPDLLVRLHQILKSE